MRPALRHVFGTARGPTIDGRRRRGLERMLHIVHAVNYSNGTENCGFIIDSVIDRLKDERSTSVAHFQRNGSFGQIESRYGVMFNWGRALSVPVTFNVRTSFAGAYEAMRSGGPGAIGLIGIIFPTDAHVVVIANVDGVVGILECQRPRAVITSVEEAQVRYNSSGMNLLAFARVR